MLHLLTQSAAGRMCDGWSRRDFLRIGALGLTGLTLPDLLRQQAQSAPARESRGKSVIVIFLPGGPSHIDMYDLKPEAPVEIRGEFRPVSTNVPGVNVCELMPLHTQLAHKFAVVHGVQTFDTHSAEVVMSGFLAKDHRPVFGSVVSKLRGSSSQGLPTYVALGGENSSDPGTPEYLGAGHRPFTPGKDLEALGRDRSLTLERFESRKSLQSSLDRLQREIDDLRSNLSGHDQFTQQAFDLLQSNRVRDAFRVEQEPEAVRQQYGPAGRVLLARRLVEAGVPVVTLSMGGTIVPGGDWDTHAGTDQRSETNFSNLRRKLPVYDRALHALLTDLGERGLEQEVLVCVCGEFGRTPRINKNGGRDHWAPAGSVLFAGGNLRLGQVIGDTGPRAERVSSHKPYTAQNVLAMLYRHLGLDLETSLPDFRGRPLALLEDRRLIQELI